MKQIFRETLVLRNNDSSFLRLSLVLEAAQRMSKRYLPNMKHDREILRTTKPYSRIRLDSN
jgi:hypothetical protein